MSMSEHCCAPPKPLTCNIASYIDLDAGKLMMFFSASMIFGRNTAKKAASV